MKNLCREYTLPLSDEASRVRAWILGNTKIGRVLDVKVCLHEKLYGIEIMVFDCEWNWQILNRNVNNHFSWKRWAQSYRETCCEGKDTTKAYCDTVSHFYSCSWKKLDRHQSREIPLRLFYSVKSHDQITVAWSINSSWRWCSTSIWRYCGRTQGKVRWYFAMAN